MNIIEKDKNELHFNCDNCWKPHSKRIEFENGVIDLCEVCFIELTKKLFNYYIDMDIHK